MADGNQLKMGDQIDVADDDPFAELTRIMGFDPRQSVKQAEAEKAGSAASRDSGRDQPSAASLAAEDDDFSIDLEKELMGEFSEDDEGLSRAVDVSREEQDDAPVVAAEDDAGEDHINFDFDDAIAASVASEVDRAAGHSETAAAPVDTHAAMPVAADDLHHDLDIDAELDAAMAGVDFEPAAAEDGFDTIAGSGDPVEEEIEEAPVFHDEHQAAELERHMADAMEEHLGADDLRLDAADLHDDEPQLDASDIDEDEPQFEAADLVLDEPDLEAFGIDEDEPQLVAAEVDAVAEEGPEDETADFRLDPSDLHFDADDLTVEESEPVQAAQSVVLEDADEADYDLGLHASDFGDLHADDPQDSVTTDEDELGFGAADDHSVEAFRPEPEMEPEISFDEHDFAVDAASYETEAEAPYVAAAEPARHEAPQRLLSPMDVAAAEYRGRETPPDLASAFNLEEELNALLGNKADATPDPDAAFHSKQPLPAAGEEDLAWELEDLVAAAASAEADLEAEHAPEPEEDPAAEETYQPAFTRSFEPDRSPAPAADGRYASVAAAATTASAFAATEPASSGSMFAKSPAFAERYQKRSENSAAQYRSNPVEAQPSAAFGAPRDPMREDPLDIIAELTAKYSQPLPTEVSGSAGYAADDSSDGAPDIETIEVADRAVALEDDLDLPEVNYDSELPPVSAYDDLDTDFASMVDDMNGPDAMPAEAANRYAARPEGDYSHPEQGGYRSNGATPPAGVGRMSTIPGVYAGDIDPYAVDSDNLAGSRAPVSEQYGDDDYGYEPDLDDVLAVPGMAAAQREQRPQRRGLLVAAIVGGVALVGALGAFALSSGGDGGSDAVAIVKADDGPIKVKPENPGGTTVPNQDSKVYDTVAGEGTTTDPQQEKLVTTAEEPVDMEPIEDDPVVAAKSEDRIEQILQEAEGKTDAQITAVAPRKVRTMVVRPDGTLVPREETEAANDEIQTDAVASAQDAVGAQVAPEATGALPQQADEAPMATLDEETGADAETVFEPEPEREVEVAATAPQAAASTPSTAPIAPQRPSEQPIDVVGEVKPDQVASAATSAGAAWSMQIASQPSEAAAQTSYKNLLARYGSVLEGREANIVKADIAGKGTFWRVRIPAASRNDAINLCETYKSAGGNCFVSK